MRAIWLLDFDGVVNALSARGGRSIWSDWHTAVVDHPEHELARDGAVVRLPLLWSATVVATIADAAAAGIDVRWLSTWREHTAELPATIPGLPALPWLDERILPDTALVDPGARNYSGPWKVEVAKAFVPEEAPLLWTEDTLSVDLLSETWRRRRPGPSTFIRPRPPTGLVQREIREIREWIDLHGSR